MITSNLRIRDIIIYVNGAARCGTTEIGRLMEDFFCTDPDKVDRLVL